MDASVINQIIESFTLLLITAIAYYAYTRGINLKADVSKEIKLLQDCYYYRLLIDRYKNNKSRDITYIEARKSVEKELGYSHSVYSEPARIKKRLERLSEIENEITDFVNKIKI